MNKMLLNSLLLRNKISGADFIKPVLAAIAVLLFCTQAFAQKPAVSKPVMKRCGTMEGIQQQMLNGLLVFEQASPELDNRRLAAKTTNPTHGFDQRICLGDSVLHLQQSPVAGG